MEQPSRFLTVGEVAEYLRVGRATIYRLANDGTLPGFKVGGRWRFDREQVEAWIAERLGTAEDKVTR